MSIEPSQARTVCIRAVLPPKPAPRVLAPKLTMAEEAALIRARTHKAWGFTTPASALVNNNATRIAESKRRRDEMADRIADLLADGRAMTLAELHHHFAVSDNHMRTVLTEMRKAGRILAKKGARNITHWRLAEGAE